MFVVDLIYKHWSIPLEKNASIRKPKLLTPLVPSPRQVTTIVGF